MYMTVLEVNFDTLKNQKYFMDFNDMNFMHRWFTSQIGKRREEEHLLFRMMYSDTSLFIYIQTDYPFPTKNVEKAGAKVFNQFEISELNNGDSVNFKILCSANRKSGFITEESERKIWFNNKTSPFLDVIELKEIRLSNVKIKNDKKIQYVEYMGSAKIKDKDAFMEAVNNGIGKCKNYGLGLFLFKKTA